MMIKLTTTSTFVKKNEIYSLFMRTPPLVLVPGWYIHGINIVFVIKFIYV